MKIKLDENLPSEMVDLLRRHNHDVHTVADEMPIGCADSLVFEAAIREGRMLFTQDLDFSDIRKFKPGTHPGLVLVRLRDPSRKRLLERITRVIEREPVENRAGCFIVISDRKLRIRRA